MKKLPNEYAHREELIGRIEGYTGTLESLEYCNITTADLEKLLAALRKNA